MARKKRSLGDLLGIDRDKLNAKMDAQREKLDQAAQDAAGDNDGVMLTALTSATIHPAAGTVEFYNPQNAQPPLLELPVHATATLTVLTVRDNAGRVRNEPYAAWRARAVHEWVDRLNAATPPAPN